MCIRNVHLERLFGPFIWNVYLERLYGTCIKNVYSERLVGTFIWNVYSEHVAGAFIQNVKSDSLFRTFIGNIYLERLFGTFIRPVSQLANKSQEIGFGVKFVATPVNLFLSSFLSKLRLVKIANIVATILSCLFLVGNC